MWLLIAELRKLGRPLVWGTMLGAAGFCVLLAWGATSNASAALSSPRLRADCVAAVTAACKSSAASNQAGDDTQPGATARMEQPGAIGQVAAGMLASMPGLLVVALLAGGHWGGEWSGRTVRSLLVREGRRGRVLAAKWVSLWVAGAVTVLVCWAALALAGPLLAAGYGLPAPRVALVHGFGTSLAATGHALVVIALFSAVGVAAGAVARGQLACTAVTGGVMVFAVVLAGMGGAGRWSPAAFVQAWMRFTRTPGYLPTNFWARFLNGPAFGEVGGLIGLLVWLAAAGAVARRQLATDVNM
jgi:ABC-type transport system involved in multi-copper enzyme maturation permease subunit